MSDPKEAIKDPRRKNSTEYKTVIRAHSALERSPKLHYTFFSLSEQGINGIV
jgi:hypothetical protein